MLILILIIINLIFFITALKRPTLFVILYILATTKFLGLFDLSVFVINGNDVGFFTINITTLISLFFRKWFIIKKSLFLLWILFTSLILYGIFFPIINGYETLKQAVIASKPFLFLILFYYVSVNFDKINVWKIINFIKALSMYLSLVEIVYIFSHLAPPFYIETYDYIGNYIRVYYPTYISLGWFLFFVDYLYKKINIFYFAGISFVLFIGLLLAGHSALAITTSILIISLWLFFDKNKFNILKFFKSTFIIFVLSASILLIFGNLRETLISNLELILAGSDIALKSREIYNEFRWEAINKSPLLGYGFIHKNASVMKNFSYNPNNRFTEKLGVQDSGYVDLLVRFGYLGMFLYLFVIIYYLFKFLKIGNRNYYILPLIAFLIQYFAVNYTWSVFSFQFGTLPMILTFFILLKTSNEKNISKKRLHYEI